MSDRDGTLPNVGRVPSLFIGRNDVVQQSVSHGAIIPLKKSGDVPSTRDSGLQWADASSASYDPDGLRDNGDSMSYDFTGSSSDAGSSSFSASGMSLDFKVTA